MMTVQVNQGETGTTDTRHAILARNAVNISGVVNAPTIVFGHGYGTDQTTWQEISERFADDYRIVRFDYVGSGASDLAAYDPIRYDSLHGYARDLIEVIDATELGPVFFVGHSVSGMIGALAAIERPDLFSSIVMVCPSPRYIDDEGYSGGFSREDVLGLLDSIEANQAEWAASLAPAVTARPDRPDVTERVRQHFVAAPLHIATQFARVVFLSDTRHRLGEIPVPCTILQSRGDIICPPHIGEYMRARIPECRLVELEGSGHFVHLAEPDLIAAQIRNALP